MHCSGAGTSDSERSLEAQGAATANAVVIPVTLLHTTRLPPPPPPLIHTWGFAPPHSQYDCIVTAVQVGLGSSVGVPRHVVVLHRHAFTMFHPSPTW